MDVRGARVAASVRMRRLGRCGRYRRARIVTVVIDMRGAPSRRRVLAPGMQRINVRGRRRTNCELLKSRAIRWRLVWRHDVLEMPVMELGRKRMMLSILIARRRLLVDPFASECIVLRTDSWRLRTVCVVSLDVCGPGPVVWPIVMDRCRLDRAPIDHRHGAMVSMRSRCRGVEVLMHRMLVRRALPLLRMLRLMLDRRRMLRLMLDRLRSSVRRIDEAMCLRKLLHAQPLVVGCEVAPGLARLTVVVLRTSLVRPVVRIRARQERRRMGWRRPSVDDVRLGPMRCRRRRDREMRGRRMRRRQMTNRRRGERMQGTVLVVASRGRSVF